MVHDAGWCFVQVMGMVGSLRKRVLLLWQAVEFSRSSERPNVKTLQVLTTLLHCSLCPSATPLVSSLLCSKGR